MINIFEVNETNKMIEQENLDVRTITMGISLLDCIDPDLDALNQKIYEKITTKARNLVATGDEIATEYGIPVVNKRISVTPIALVGGAACKKPEDFVTIARTLDKCAKEVGVNFIGGYSALVSKGMTPAEELLIRSIPQAMAETERVCSSVNVGSTKADHRCKDRIDGGRFYHIRIISGCPDRKAKSCFQKEHQKYDHEDHCDGCNEDIFPAF